MHVQNKYSWIKHVDFMALNLIALIVSFIVSFYAKFGSLSLMLTSTWEGLLAILCLINIIATLGMNPYSGILRRPYHADAIKLFLLTLNIFIAVVVLFYLFKIGAAYSRVMLITTFVLYYLLSLSLLYVRKRLILSGKIKLFNVRERQLLAVIDLEDLDDVIESIGGRDIKEYKIAGYCFPEDEYKGETIGDVPVIRRADMVDHVLRNHIDDVYISVGPGELDAASYKALVENGVNVQLDIESLTGIKTDDQFISHVGAFTTLSVGPYAMDSGQAFYMIVKRFLDIILGLIGLMILVPVTILIKAAYLISGDTAPVFYKSIRIGRYGREFMMYKFRTMVPDAEKILEELLEKEEYSKEWENKRKIDRDPRITAVGRVLRRTSLDEIPQVINILKGDMSVVGPRPLVPGELEMHNGLTLYNKVRPGLTGWWACNGRSNIGYKERFELEYYYVKNCSLKLDILCLARTFFAVLRREGAQ